MVDGPPGACVIAFVSLEFVVSVGASCATFVLAPPTIGFRCAYRNNASYTCLRADLQNNTAELLTHEALLQQHMLEQLSLERS